MIEDEDLLRKALAFFLRSNGYEVTEFDNGSWAIQYILENHEQIDLVITDLNLPDAGESKYFIQPILTKTSRKLV